MKSSIPYHFIYTCLCILTVISCESVIEIDDSNFEPQLVINSYFAPDSVWEVKLTHTKSVFDGSTDLSVENANIIIQDLTSNLEFDLDHSGGGLYETSYKPQDGHVYHIIVDDEELGVSQAIGKVPSVDHIEVIGSIIEDQNSQYLDIEVLSSQSNNSDTYYAWQLVNIEDTNLVDGGGIFSNTNEQISSAVNTREFTTDNLVFVEGSTLDDGSVRDSIPGEVVTELTSQGQEGEFGCNAAIKLIAVSKELYNYLESNDQQTALEGSNTHHRPQHYTNIKNGVGIFAGYKEVYIQL